MIGFVYVLSSPNARFIKIGGTTQPLAQRLRSINATPGYSELGPWKISDFLHVSDWKLVEAKMHASFKTNQISDVAGTRELFDVHPLVARKLLQNTAPELRIGHVKTAEIFKSQHLKLFLHRLLECTGLYGHLDIQGAWTLSLFPSTSGGRYFTLNIGSHEVAFSPRGRRHEGKHLLVMDQLASEFPEVIDWLERYTGNIREAPYKTARSRAISIEFQSDFATAENFFLLPGVRRALAAYWSEALADLREREIVTAYERFHNYDAVSALLNYREAARLHPASEHDERALCPSD